MLGRGHSLLPTRRLGKGLILIWQVPKKSINSRLEERANIKEAEGHEKSPFLDSLLSSHSRRGFQKKRCLLRLPRFTRTHCSAMKSDTRDSSEHVPLSASHQPAAGTGAIRLPLGSACSLQSTVRHLAQLQDQRRRRGPCPQLGTLPSPGLSTVSGQPGVASVFSAGQTNLPGSWKWRGLDHPAHHSPGLLPACLALQHALEMAMSWTLALPWRESVSWGERDTEAAVYKTTGVIGVGTGTARGLEEVGLGTDRWRPQGNVPIEGP